MCLATYPFSAALGHHYELRRRKSHDYVTQLALQLSGLLSRSNCATSLVFGLYEDSSFWIHRMLYQGSSGTSKPNIVLRLGGIVHVGGVTISEGIFAQ